MKELKLAVIGKDVSASLSPQIHNFIAGKMGNRVQYRKISIPEESFEESIVQIIGGLNGFNVTIPYKLSIIPHLKATSGDAKVFGAVNTVTTFDMCGYNTDGLGFMMTLQNNGVEVNGKTALVLGAGGAGRSVSKKLLDAGAHVSVYDKSYASANRLAEEFRGLTALNQIPPLPYFLIVNATGVGMHNSVGQSPVGEELIAGCSVAMDLIYTPPKSKFLEVAERQGKKIINGAGMLFYQAYFAECLYFGISPDNAQAERLFNEYQKENMQ